MDGGEKCVNDHHVVVMGHWSLSEWQRGLVVRGAQGECLDGDAQMLAEMAFNRAPGIAVARGVGNDDRKILCAVDALQARLPRPFVDDANACAAKVSCDLEHHFPEFSHVPDPSAGVAPATTTRPLRRKIDLRRETRGVAAGLLLMGFSEDQSLQYSAGRREAKLKVRLAKGGAPRGIRPCHSMHDQCVHHRNSAEAATVSRTSADFFFARDLRRNLRCVWDWPPSPQARRPRVDCVNRRLADATYHSAA